MERASIIEAALSSRGALIKVRDIQEAIDLANRIAPEHLELALTDAEQWVPKIRHAGAIFVGPYAAEALGDYCAGPNHVLPTGRTARFSSPLGVYDFQKRSSLIICPAPAASKLGRTAAILARAEGLTAHARSAEYRILPER
jgi:histidinol dehydrogenase